eukprot:scaffold48_cov122-Skeletonema_menzelii.AAC.8
MMKDDRITLEQWKESQEVRFNFDRVFRRKAFAEVKGIVLTDNILHIYYFYGNNKPKYLHSMAASELAELYGVGVRLFLVNVASPREAS